MNEGPRLPYYLIKGEKIRMGLASKTQAVDANIFADQMQRIDDIYQFFSALRNEPQYANGMPIDTQKAPKLAEQLKTLPSPLTAAARLDIVDGQVVDINNKPAGLGLTLTAFRKWELDGVLSSEDNQLTPNVSATLGKWGPVNLVTERAYPFQSDQRAIAAEVTRATNNEWTMCYADILNPPTNGKPVFGFSYLESPEISDKWLQFLSAQPDLFAVSPLTALYWDNKALMALPFLELAGFSENIRSAATRAKSAFPETYLVRQGANKKPEIAVGFGSQGLEYVPADRDSTPVFGLTYLKPLGMSGSKGIQVKTYDSWSNARDGMESFTAKYPEGFIFQKGTVAPVEDGMAIKDGYFIDASSGKAEFIALERMGTTADAKKIHGGSKTKLIPVLLEK